MFKTRIAFTRALVAILLALTIWAFYNMECAFQNNVMEAVCWIEIVMCLALIGFLARAQIKQLKRRKPEHEPETLTSQT